MSKSFNSNVSREDVHKKGKTEKEFVQNKIDSEPKKDLFLSLNTSSDTVRQVNGRSMTDNSTIIHPVKSDEGWTSTEKNDENGAVAMLDTREYSPQDNLQEIVSDLKDSHEEYFEDSPNSMRIYVEGEGSDASVSIGVQSDDRAYANQIAKEKNTKLIDSNTQKEIDIDNSSNPLDRVDTKEVMNRIETEHKKSNAEYDKISDDEEEIANKIRRMDEIDNTGSSVEDIISDIPQDNIDRAVAVANGERVYKLNDETRTVETPDGEELEVTSSPVCRNAVVKIDDQTAINIRAGAGLPADIPTEPDNVREYISAMYDKDEKFRNLSYKQNVMDLSQVDADLTWDDDINREKFTEHMTELTSDESKELMDTVGDGNISDMDKQELKEMFGENKAEEVTKFSNTLDMAKGGEKPMKLPSVGVGGSIYAYWGDCDKGCANCGRHGPYKQRGYRDSRGVSTSEYIGKV